MIGNQLFDQTNAILATLFDREFASLTKRELAIVRKHIALGGSKDGFRHMGVIYSELSSRMKRHGTYDRLHSSLAPEMNSLLTERKILEVDRERIKQALALVLRDTHTLQDVRDALPNCLRDLVPAIKGLDRSSRQEAYTLADNPRAYSQYMRLREKIEFYVAAQMLY